jgi:predicted CopG family antitoxin
MATKTITIDTEAYDRLKVVQQENESFSQTIKRVVPRPVSTEDLIALFRQAGSKLSEGFFRGVQGALAERNTPADKERIDGMLGHERHSGSPRPRGSAKATRRRGKTKAA